MDGRRITNHDYDSDTGILNYTCPRMKLGWHQAQIVVVDDGELRTSGTARFRVVFR